MAHDSKRCGLPTGPAVGSAIGVNGRTTTVSEAIGTAHDGRVVAVACVSVPAALLPDLQQADAASNLPRNVPERRLAEPPRRVTRCVSLALGWGTQDTQLSAIIGTHEYGVLHDPPSRSALRRPVADFCVRLCALDGA